VSIGIEWVGMTWWWDDEYSEGYGHAQDMFQTELGYLYDAEATDAMKAGVATTVRIWTELWIDFAFIDSGILEGLSGARVVDVNDGLLISFMKSFNAAVFDYTIAATYILMTFFVRLGILLLSLPIFVLLGFVGLTDGLMRRDLRKFRVEHESSFVYHIAKSIALPLMISGCIMYLSMPFTVHPNLVITPYAVLFAYTLSVMASKFKKYL
jgi:integrating conjugative element membrane protein (TIGR03747 family)